MTFVSLLLISGCGDKENTEENNISNSKKSMSEIFNVKTTTGKDITIIIKKEAWEFKGLEDKVILLNFFGTWCVPCKAEIPHLNIIKSKLKKDFEILAVDLGVRGGGLNSQEHLNNFIQEFNITYPIITGEFAGEIFATVSEFNPSGLIPFMVLFNKKGQAVEYYLGMTPEEMLFHDITSTIKMN